ASDCSDKADGSSAASKRNWRTFDLVHMRLTLVVGIAGMLHLIAATIVIFTLPVDIAKGLLGVLSLGTDAIILAIALGGIGYFLRRCRTPPRQSRTAPTSPAVDHI
ncbi:MAG: hypothetical protein J2P17_21615, partial [Mycobacterium sp.]|nr:hypothetical protein [Mycobacterium sp.]